MGTVNGEANAGLALPDVVGKLNAVGVGLGYLQHLSERRTRMVDKPKARSEGVISEQVGDDLVVYDVVAQAAHCLSATAASVWERCDGESSAAEIGRDLVLEPEVVERALGELRACVLLDEGLPRGHRYSRREATLKFAKVTGAAFAAPLIYSVAVPAAASAASLCGGVTCMRQDQCHSLGTCDPNTGQCSNPVSVDGTACNDGNACTQTDTCQSGVCTGTNPVVCTPLDQCHVAGTCDFSTGACSNPPAPDGTTCSTGMCVSGVCQPA